MSATIASSILPIVSRRGLTTSEASLVSLLRTKASWIWTTEDTMTAPTAPVNVQRAFRKSFTFPAQSKPSNVTILVAADDYFAMYVNGVLVQAADTTHDYHNILAYNVPLPVVTSSSSSVDQEPPLVLGFRVINKTDKAGLLVAVQVNYPAPQAPDQFYTGLDQTWLGEPLFPEHWEQPWFDSTTPASSWRPALVRTAEEMSPDIPALVRQEVVVMGALEGAAVDGNIGPPAQQGTAPTPSGDVCAGGGSGCSGSVTLSKGGFAGALVGTALAAFVVAAVVAFLLARRRYRYGSRVRRESGEVFWGVAERPQVEEVQPATKPGRTMVLG